MAEDGRCRRDCWSGAGAGGSHRALADLGADVIKVEAPAGDETRGWGPPFADDGAAAYFHACNAGSGRSRSTSAPADLRGAIAGAGRTWL